MDQEALFNFICSSEFLEASKNATRLVAKLKSAVESRELYEAHQLIRTINFRFINNKEKLPALQNLLFLGSRSLLESKEYVSGQDIAVLFLESSAKRLQNYQEENRDDAKQQLSNPSLIYHSDRHTMAHEICSRTSQLIVKIPDTEIGQQKYVADVLRILSTKLLNRSLLHNVIAEEFWHHKDYVNARYHYLHCASLENAEDIAKLLVEYQTSCASKSEIDLFITQFTLQFLCLQCPLDPPKALNQTSTPTNHSNPSISRKTRSTIKSISEKVFYNYAINHPQLSQVSIPFSSLPLLNFTYFIISIIDGTNETTTFETLRDLYKATWIRDPNYQGYLTRIGALYFSIVDPTKQRQNGGGGLFNNILQSLLDGSDENEEETNLESNNFSSSDELD